MRVVPLAVLGLLLLSGCFGGSPKGTDGAPAPSDTATAFAWHPATDVLMPCDGCYEPAAAVDPQGRIYVAAHRVPGVAVSTDGGQTFTVKEVPDPSSPLDRAGGASDDEIQVAPWGDVFYSELWSDGGGSLGAGLHIASTADGGETWPMNQFISARTMPASLAFESDRQWFAFDGDHTVYIVYNCAASAVICLLRSDDRGVTWGPASSIVLPTDHSFPAPAGFPAVGPDGTLLIPYFADPRPDPGLGARSIKVASSMDGGRTFTQSTAYTHPPEDGTSGGGWPEATILADGSWVASWSTGDGTMWVAVSHDRGASWDAKAQDPAQTGEVGGHPFLRPRHDGGFDAVWFGDPGVGAGRFTRDGELVAVALSADKGGGSSDYPFFDHDAQDRIVMPFIGEGGNGLHLAITTV